MKKQIAASLLLCILLTNCSPKSGDISPDDSGNQDHTEQTYERGTLSETGYESRYMGLRFIAPEGFTMATAEEIDTLMNAGAEALGLEEGIIDLANLTTVYEMMVSAPLGVPNVVVMAEKPLLNGLTPDQYLEALKIQLTNLPAMSYSVEGRITPAVVAGQTYSKLTATLEMEGISMVQDYYVRKAGERFAALIVSYSAETESEMRTLLDGFTTY
ncbi:MAG: hypothetical protein LBR72_09380 [Oscillospiraceae bacterium]|jgi:hypothetical protein|nr:hypothetical protein [Oscillospiraceae bacterium]